MTHARLTPMSLNAAPVDERSRLAARVAELEREREHLVAVVDILTEISASLHFVDILQTIAKKLGQTFGLDRCSIYLAGESQDVRLMATYEDPSLSNLIVDLDRYPELKRAFASGETVFIPDAANDPMFQGVQMMLALRNVRSIVVVPIRWRGTTIGAIFLRTERDAAPFDERDVRFCQVVASLTANALRNAHRFEAAVRDEQEAQVTSRRGELAAHRADRLRAPVDRPVHECRGPHVGGDAAGDARGRGAGAARVGGHGSDQRGSKGLICDGASGR